MYCYNAWKKSGQMPNHLDTSSTKRILKKAINEMQPERVVFSGGEPFMRSDWKELFSFVHSFKLPITVISNGALLEDEDFDFCKKNGVDTFEFTLLSADKKIHDILTRPKGDFSAFDNVVWATQKAVQKGFSVIHIFVATHQNLKGLLKTMELSYALGVRTFLLNRFNAGGEGLKHLDKLQITPLEMMVGLKTADDFALRHPTFEVSCAVNIHPCLVDLKQFKNVKMTGCGVAENQRLYLLDPVGNIRLCNFSSIDVGNILEQSFDEIISSEKAKDFISAHPIYCKGCSDLPRCQGGCKASADNSFGSPCMEDDWLRKYK
jgi:radical SAM protein with 4Fe4S-binding SPASM domain